MRAVTLAAGLLLISPNAHARDVCDYLNTYCAKDAGRLPELGGALASFPMRST